MVNTFPYPVLVIGENAPEGLLSVLGNHHAIGKVYTAVHPYQVEAIIRNQLIAMIMISMRDWNIHMFEQLR